MGLLPQHARPHAPLRRRRVPAFRAGVPVALPAAGQKPRDADNQRASSPPLAAPRSCRILQSAGLVAHPRRRRYVTKITHRSRPAPQPAVKDAILLSTGSWNHFAEQKPARLELPCVRVDRSSSGGVVIISVAFRGGVGDSSACNIEWVMQRTPARLKVVGQKAIEHRPQACKLTVGGREWARSFDRERSRALCRGRVVAPVIRREILIVG
jgi:hypothetical protein